VSIVAPLTERQLEYVQLVANGLANKEIARRLGVSAKCVENMLGAIGRRLGTRNRTHMAVRAIREGWIV
jgi:two-component system nitrate/nitrite response regulator NarL